VRRILPWLYIALMFAFAGGFLIAAQAQSAAANTYKQARECPDTASPDCYQLSQGTIRSVSISQTRGGERDTTVIDTRGTAVTVVLEPSDSDAPHVRTGAAVTVKWYQGKVTLVQAGGAFVSSTDNPASQQSDSWFYGISFLGLGGLTLLVQIWLRRRRMQRAALLAGAGDLPATRLESAIVPSGEPGWIVKPALKASTLVRLAVACGAVILLSLRGLEDPARSAAAAALDIAVIALGGLVIFLLMRNSKVIANRREITRVSWLGRTVTYPVSEVLHADRFSSSANRYLVFAGRDGRQLFRVAGIYWDYDQLDELCREVGISLVGGYDEVVGALGKRKRARASTDWLGTGGQIAALIVIVIAFVVVQIGPTSR
jgi:hypothetical protein